MGSAVTVIVFLRKSSPALSSVPAARLEMGDHATVALQPARSASNRKGTPSARRPSGAEAHLTDLAESFNE